MKTFKGLKKYKKNITSQYGENGIISEILNRLDIKSGTLIEFGASDGVWMSNTNHLLKTGNWNCVYIEPHDKYFDLLKLQEQYPDKLTALHIPVNTKTMHEYIPGTSIDEIVNEYCPEGLDLISIDIDSFDYHIFKEMQYKPSVVIIEINAFFVPTVRYIHQTNRSIYGSSFLATLELGNSKGYSLVEQVGCNMFFIREDLCRGFEMPNQKRLYDWAFIKKYGTKFTQKDVYDK